MADTIDSNVTGSRIAEEASPGVLPATPIWYPAEPNSYNDFGGQYNKTPRAPITSNRQRRKGNVLGLDASGGFVQDFTETGLLRLMQGFLYANMFSPADTQPLNGTPVALTGVTQTGSVISAAAGLNIFETDDLVLLSGFARSATNGLKTVAGATATTVTLDEALGADEVPPVSARVQKVGVQVTDVSVVVSGTEVFLETAGAVDFTTWGLVPGSWLFIGSDNNAFATEGNTCFVRVDAITETQLTLGKTTMQMSAEGATTVDIFMPQFVRNAPTEDLLVRRTYQIERTLGRDANGVQSEYLPRSAPSEFTLNVPTEDYITAELAFVSGSHETRTGAEGVKLGTRPSQPIEEAFNSSSDVRRLRMALVAPGNPYPSALFGYAQEGTVTINNNVTANKGIGVLGAVSMSLGTFDVGGDWTVYFNTVEAIRAVKDNTDVTIDLVMALDNQGWVFDIPLLTLGDGRANVEAGSPITLPLETSASESELGHTLMVARFGYLPDAA